MNDKNIINDYINKTKWEEPNIEIVENVTSMEDSAVNSQMRLTSRAATQAAEAEKFSDVKQYPENPFIHTEENPVNVQLSSGNFIYEVTDFVLPGRDGFDLNITRRYDSGCANLVDMYPYYRKGKLKTGSKDNNHYTQNYGLGYGWSFILPSIERVKSLDNFYDEYMTGCYDYILHLEDGRSLNISRYSDKFYYSLKDVDIFSKTGQIGHPYVSDLVKDYHIVIKYKNGNKDYFQEVNGYGIRPDEYGLLELNYKLVARQDKFGNVICFDLNDYGGMTIVDTWGRTLSLVKTKSGLTWNLPGGESGKNCELSYRLEQTKPLKLISVTDVAGCVAKYDYYHPDEFNGDMRYANKTGLKNCKYLLLRDITYPSGTCTKFEYRNAFIIESESGRRIKYFPIAVKKEMTGGIECNREEYSYEAAEKKRFIKSAIVTKHQDIEETYQISESGQIVERVVRDQTVLISKNVYKYKGILMIYAKEQTFHRDDESKMLEKITTWEYSDDKKADITKESVAYTGDSGSDEEITRGYGSYSIVTEISRKNRECCNKGNI